MTPEQEIEEIKNATFKKFKNAKQTWILEDYGAGFILHTWTPDGVAPPTSYASKREIASRLLQLLQIGPVAPQTWPEEVCISSVNME